MAESVFRFREFVVRQDKCAMKVGTDGVLLGAWITPAANVKRILDIGTGTGLLALMLAQKTKACIDAIDIDPAACRQAEENFRLSPWSDRLYIYHCSLQQYRQMADKKYDLIVSNPPYFSRSIKTPAPARTVARHNDDTLAFDELIEGAIHLLHPHGQFHTILPTHQGETFRHIASRMNLFNTRLTCVVTRMGKPAKRWLMSFQREKSSLHTDVLILQLKDNSFSHEYIQLTRDYYPALKSHRQN
jgi:tRNA1Val (adenine37-N6)-methyltransferase